MLQVEIAARGHQHLEHAELLRRQLQLDVAAVRSATGGLEAEVADLQHLESGASIAPSIADLKDLDHPASEIAQLILGS